MEKLFVFRESWRDPDAPSSVPYPDDQFATVTAQVLVTAEFNPLSMQLHLRFSLKSGTSIVVWHNPSRYTSTNAYDAFGLWPVTGLAIGPGITPANPDRRYRSYGQGAYQGTWIDHMEGVLDSPDTYGSILLGTVDVSYNGLDGHNDILQGALVSPGYWERTITLTSEDFDQSGNYVGPPLLAYTQRYLYTSSSSMTDDWGTYVAASSTDRMAYAGTFTMIDFADFRYHPGAIKKSTGWESHNRPNDGKAMIRKSNTWASSENTEIWNNLLSAPDNDGFIRKSGSWIRQNPIGNNN